MPSITTAEPSNPLVRSSLSRRRFLAGLPVAALALAACGTDTGTATSTTSSGSPSSTGSSTSGTAATSSTASSSTGTTTPGSVAALTLAFVATLSSDQQATVMQQYSLANAELWSNLPQALLGGGGMGGAATGSGNMPTGGGMPTDSGSMPTGGPGGTGGMPTGGGMGGGGSAGARLGIQLTELDDSQLAAFDTLLKAATGSAAGLGYDEIQQHLNADDYLAANGGGSDYGRANFYIAVLGTPADTGTWEFQFGGHHLAVANTYIDGALVGATPSFRGIEPNAEFTQDGTTNQPLKVKEAAFTALLAGLSTDELAAAKLDKVYSDLVCGAGVDWAFPTTSEGLQVSTLSADTKQLVLAAIATYVNDIADADAATILATYESQLDSTYVAYSGTAALTEQNDYVRIDGPGVWIEFSMQRGIVLSGNHPHSVWRDRNTDYGGTKS